MGEMYVATDTDDEQLASTVPWYAGRVSAIHRTPETATDATPTELVLVEVADKVEANHIPQATRCVT